MAEAQKSKEAGIDWIEKIASKSKRSADEVRVIFGAAGQDLHPVHDRKRVDGDVSDLRIVDFSFLAFTLSADAFNGYLTTSRSAISFADLAATPNEKAVAGALDMMAASNPLWQQVVGASEAQARASFTSLSNASIHANAAGALSEQSQYLRDAVTGRLRQDFAYGASLAQPGSALSYADRPSRNAYMRRCRSIRRRRSPLLAQVYSVWVQALRSRVRLRATAMPRRPITRSAA